MADLQLCQGQWDFEFRQLYTELSENTFQKNKINTLLQNLRSIQDLSVYLCILREFFKQTDSEENK